MKARNDHVSTYLRDTNNGEPVTVTMGYDRALDYVFCTVTAKNGDIVYTNLDDDGAGTTQQSVDYFRRVLATLGLRVPEALFREVAFDQRRRVGNRVVRRVAEE
jgi:hypothetical protein